jgi:hypothetical protein
MLLTQGFKVSGFASLLPAGQRMHTLPSSIPERFAASKVFHITFRFYQVTFPYGAKTEEKQHQTLSENGGEIKQKSYVRDVYLFSLLNSYSTSEKLSEGGEKLSNKCQNEYWNARELYKLLGYSRWEKFQFALEQAQKACENSGQAVADHFHLEVKMITAGKSFSRNQIFT